MTCPVCEQQKRPKDAAVCDACAGKIPLALLVAAERGGRCALGLRGGGVVRFERASLSSEFISLWLGDEVSDNPPEVEGLPVKPAGEIAVRLSEIAWCCEESTSE